MDLEFSYQRIRSLLLISGYARCIDQLLKGDILDFVPSQIVQLILDLFDNVHDPWINKRVEIVYDQDTGMSPLYLSWKPRGHMRVPVVPKFMCTEGAVWTIEQSSWKGALVLHATDTNRSRTVQNGYLGIIP